MLELSKEYLESKIFGVGVNSTNRIRVAFKLLKNKHIKINDKTYWNIIRVAYDCSDNIFSQVSYKILKDMFTNPKRKHREHLMNIKEINHFDSLPDIITIHRGCSIVESESGKYGISWTLSKEVANFYTSYIRNGLKEKGVVISKEIPKCKIIAYLNDREENEIIYISE